MILLILNRAVARKHKIEVCTHFSFVLFAFNETPELANEFAKKALKMLFFAGSQHESFNFRGGKLAEKILCEVINLIGLVGLGDSVFEEDIFPEDAGIPPHVPAVEHLEPIESELAIAVMVPMLLFAILKGFPPFVSENR